MKKGTDWYPNRTADQIEMATIWVKAFAEKGVLWSIPQETIKNFTDLAAETSELFHAAQDKKKRTIVISADSRAALARLEAAMRDIKRRYLHMPPLTEGDYAWLHLRLRDSIPTPSRAPIAQAKVETFLEGRHELGTKVVYVEGDPNDPANAGFRIYHTVQKADESPPEHPSQLKDSFFTRRKKGRITFDPRDSGKICHFAVQIENEGKKGPWGPITSALIP